MFNVKEVVAVLSVLRQRAEEEAGLSCDQIETDMASVLLDVCEAFGLDQSQQMSVLGLDAYQAIHEPAKIELVDEKLEALRADVARVYAKSRNVVIFGE